jgi:hypothetical protein
MTRHTLDKAILAYRENPTHTTLAQLHRAQHAYNESFITEQTGIYQRQTRMTDVDRIVMGAKKLR